MRDASTMARIIVLLLFNSVMLLQAQAGWPDPDSIAWDSVSVEDLERILQTENVNAAGRYGRTPLMSLAKWNPLPELLTLLLDAGADIQKTDNHGRTAFMYYVINNPIQIDTLQFFLDSGADINAPDNDGMTVLMTALMKQRNQPVAIRAIVDAGADVNSATMYGATPLMFAFYYSGYMDNLRLLLDAGAEINARTQDGLTPLLIAAFSGFAPDNIGFLINAGADVNARDASGYTPLKATLFPMRAYVRDATYIVKFLLDAEADFKSDSWDSQTLEPILMQAAWEGFTGVVETLLEAGVSANAHNEIGHSALMSAVGGRSPAEIVRKLLEAGADANAENINGRTALHWALTPIYGEIDPEVISLLIEAGADVNAVDSDKRTPLKIAQDKNDPQIVTILRDSGAR